MIDKATLNKTKSFVQFSFINHGKNSKKQTIIVKEGNHNPPQTWAVLKDFVLLRSKY